MPHCDIAALTNILNELMDGSLTNGAYVLNSGDAGLLNSLERLTATEASKVPRAGGASVAAHVDHLRYGLSLLNRWRHGEQPFADADYTASWKRGQVSPDEWDKQRAALRREAYAWRDALPGLSSNMSTMEQNGVVASVVHLAYHMGAMRQIHRDLRGPSAKEADEGSVDPQQLG